MMRIRRARPIDIEGIADIVGRLWQQDVIRDVCEAQMGDDACALWVAAEDDYVAGFASGFLTVAQDGQRRWEVDLVGVRPCQQGQGLGTLLISRVSEAGHRQGASLTRALMRVDNVPSESAFERAGFSRKPGVQRLFLWSPEPNVEVGSYARRVTLLPVETLIYRGIWIEHLTSVPPLEQRRAVVAARSIASRESRLNAGALVAIDDEHLLAPDLRDQAQLRGEYRWFLKRYRDAT